MRGRAGLISTVGCLLLLAATIADAGVLTARLRWWPSASPEVVGYRVYLRPAGGAYGAGADVGLPAPSPDGTLSTVVGGLRDGTTYFFEMTAYQADGSESTPSSEMSLGGGTGPATDVCAAAAEPLRVGRFLLRPRGARVLTARGSFPVAGDLDPTVAGVSVELRGSGGEMLYGATVPPSAFDSNRRHTRFRYARTRGLVPAGADGLDRLLLRHAGDEGRVLLAGSAPALVAAAQEPRLELVIRVGDQCARSDSLLCTVRPARTACERAPEQRAGKPRRSSRKGASSSRWLAASSSTRSAKRTSRALGGRAPGRIQGTISGGAASIALRGEPHGGDTVGEAPEDRAGNARDDPDARELREQRAAEEIAPPGGAEEEPRRPLRKALDRGHLGRNTGVVEEPGVLGRALRFLRANWLFTVPLGVLALILRLWYARSRDPRFRPVAPRYEWPDGLSPAELGTLVANRADTRDITATIVDLAVRGRLVIEERDEEGLLDLWSIADFTVHRQQAGAGDLESHERTVPNGIFSERGDRVAPSDLENEF